MLDTGPEGREVSWRVPDSFSGTLKITAVAADPGSVGVAQERAGARLFVITPSLRRSPPEMSSSFPWPWPTAWNGPEAPLSVAIEPRNTFRR